MIPKFCLTLITVIVLNCFLISLGAVSAHDDGEESPHTVVKRSAGGKILKGGLIIIIVIVLLIVCCLGLLCCFMKKIKDCLFGSSEEGQVNDQPMQPPPQVVSTIQQPTIANPYAYSAATQPMLSQQPAVYPPPVPNNPVNISSSHYAAPYDPPEYHKVTNNVYQQQSDRVSEQVPSAPPTFQQPSYNPSFNSNINNSPYPPS